MGTASDVDMAGGCFGVVKVLTVHTCVSLYLLTFYDIAVF